MNLLEVMGLTYFEDLTEYTYKDRGIVSNTLNIGWLDVEYPYEIGEVPTEFVEKLWDLIHIRLIQLRGFHDCNLCKPKSLYTRISERHGETLKLGDAEIRAFGDFGKIYAAPNLIYHYVTDHSYKPPTEFISAVIKSPPANSIEYRKILKHYRLISEFEEKYLWESSK